MNRRNTKRALCMSFVSLLLCCSMLVGSTFAWFTDTATTSVNSIQSGTLDVVLEMSYDNGATWEDAEGKSLEFRNVNGSDEILWEPGAEFKLPQLRIRNNGNLALKFKVVVSGLTGDMMLADVLDVNLAVNDTAKAAVGTLTQVMALNASEIDGMIHGELAAKAISDVYELSLKMQESANNDYQNKTLSGMAITVYATQQEAEYDSFTNEYDKDAYYSDAAMVEEGKATTITAGTTTVVIPADGLTAGTVAQLKVVGTDGTGDFITAYDTVMGAYNISIVDANGNEVQPTKSCEVTMNIAKNLDASKVELYHNGVKVESISYTASTGVLKFSTASFSPFVVLYKNVATVDTAEKLIAVAAAINADTNKGAGVEINLAKNIDLAGVTWTPIKEFAGTFNGQGYTISNLTLDCSNDITHSSKCEPLGGLFDTITKTGSVKNLTLANASANLKGYYSIGLVARSMAGKAENCVVNNAAIVVDGYLIDSGAMFGAVNSGAVINQCSAEDVTITITGTDNGNTVGGLFGLINSSKSTEADRVQVTGVTIKNVTINASQKTKSFGGFVGEVYYATMKDCAVENLEFTVATNYQMAGGFAAAIGDGAQLDNCVVSGAKFDIAGGGRFGGFAGRTYNWTDPEVAVSLKNCKITGLNLAVSGKITSYVSGFCGNTNGDGPTTMENCSVEGVMDITGVTGYNATKASVQETVKSDNPDNDSLSCTANVTIMK